MDFEKCYDSFQIQNQKIILIYTLIDQILLSPTYKIIY